jgi:hypothetical protein
MRKLLLFVSVAAIAAFANPARAQFCPGVSPWVFDDVLASDPFCGFVTWMAENGITLGCQVIDANHRLYCPAQSVSRLQIAAFMKHLGDVRVEAVDTGPGLLGGPITSVGTITLAPTQLLPTTACANNQVPRWNGSAWTCATLAAGGSVTSIASGTGLTGGPITTTGTLSVATSYQLPQGCANGQVAKSNGSGTWTCAGDNNGGGTVTSITAGNGLTGGTITTTGTIAVDPNSTTLAGNYFKRGGNAFGTVAVLGTTDNNPLELRINGMRIARFESGALGPNTVVGHPANVVSGAHSGQFVGGGSDGTDCFDPATSTQTHLCANQSLEHGASVAGGRANVASGNASAVAGGASNTASANFSAVAGGGANTASGDGALVAGGTLNIASGDNAFVAGGTVNIASGFASFAAGTGARTQSAGGAVHHGAFAWADASNVIFNTAASNEFAVRATGGARFVTAINAGGNPTREVKINANGELEFNAVTRSHLNFFGASYAIGVQPFTLYYRTADVGIAPQGGFSWFRGGIHEDNVNAPGAGGVELMRLALNGTLYVTGGTVGTLSDRAAKQDFATIDTSDILERVAQMPLLKWSYKSNPSVRHIGPTAQDFRAALDVGDDDARSIATVDADGVALAAIQGLNAKVESQAREIAELRRMLEALLRERAVAAR